MGELEEYRQVEALRDRLERTHADTIRRVKEAIDEYAAGRDEIYSNRAGRAILPKCGLVALCDNKASAVFGIILRDHLTEAGWSMEDGYDGRRKTKIYRR